MTYLLDTNICSAFMKRPGQLAHRFVQNVGRIAVPTIVIAELYTWGYRNIHSEKALDTIRDLLSDCIVFDYTIESAREFGNIRATLLNQGIVVNPVDLMIASVAIVHQLTLVTHNTKHFDVIPGLQLVDWLS